MSISINSKNRNSLLITHEAVNFSPSKTTYSFAKGQRFKSLAPVGPPDVIYKLPSTLKTKKITFGIGERFRQRKADCKYFSRFNFRYFFVNTNSLYPLPIFKFSNQVPPQNYLSVQKSLQLARIGLWVALTWRIGPRCRRRTSGRLVSRRRARLVVEFTRPEILRPEPRTPKKCPAPDLTNTKTSP